MRSLAALSLSHRTLGFPRAPRDARGLRRFENLAKLPPGVDRDFAVSALNLILAPGKFYRLPYSYRGVHILEDRGLSELSIPVPGGGTWNSLYRVFLVATEGRVETAGIGLNRCNPKNIILCVAFLKSNRKHHALQLHFGRNVEPTPGGFAVFHDGRMGGRSIRREAVRDALIESCRDDLVAPDGRIDLGTFKTTPTWSNSRKLLANVFNYALLRTNLREANPWSRRG
ncbi:hypothetical protein K8I61_07850 [bacterium]|nr:hypothetical protein [bacterium]